jgi:hypothetical protein
VPIYFAGGGLIVWCILIGLWALAHRLGQPSRIVQTTPKPQVTKSDSSTVFRLRVLVVTLTVVIVILLLGGM